MSELNLKLVGPITDSSGIAQVSREFAISAYDMGINIQLVDVTNFNIIKAEIQPERMQKLELMKKNRVSNFISLYTCPLDRNPSVDTDSRANIFWTLYETNKIPYVWSLIFKNPLVTELWVPTQFNYDTFSKYGLENKLKIVPMGVDTERYNLNGDRFNFRKDDEFCFAFISTFKECKGIDILLTGFFEEFKNDEKVKLIFKTDTNSDKKDEEIKTISNIVKAYKKDSKAEVIYIPDNFSEEKMEKLYRSIDCLVMPSRGEGWNLAAVQSMACGKPVIVSNSTAMKSYCTTANSFLINTTMRKIDDIAWLLKVPSQQEHFWWEPDINDFKKLMRNVYTDQENAKKVGLKAYEDIQKLDWKNSVMKALIELKKYC